MSVSWEEVSAAAAEPARRLREEAAPAPAQDQKVIDTRDDPRSEASAAKGRIAGATEELDAAALPDPARRVEPFPGVVVLPDIPSVELRSWVCLDAGWLEQIACAPGTREHEALVVPQAIPSQIHAALLLAGFEPGHPGSWSLTPEGQFVFAPPEGSALDVLVRYRPRLVVLIPIGPLSAPLHAVELRGEEVEEPIVAWIRDHHGAHEFPDAPWIFAGSRFVEVPTRFGGGEHYLADDSGSIVGLVTFGDEVVGFSRVMSDDAAVQPPEWELNRERVPPVGTEVTLILRGRLEAGESSAEAEAP